MVTLTQLKNFLDGYFCKELIDKARKIDHRPNGLQLSGKEKIKKIILGVSATEQFLKEAVKNKADVIIVHHALSLDNVGYQLIHESLKKRLKILLDNNVSLFGYHYILDHHPKIGNNAAVIKQLGAKIDEPLFDDWGWSAEFSHPQNRDKLAQKCSAIFSHDVFVINGKNSKIKRIGVCSGGGVPREETLQQIIEANLDLYITGEARESTVGIFRELGINYFACGHYATEVFGVQNLGLVIKDKFIDKVEIEFLDVPNPL